ncbi:motility protein A [Oceanibacterium hippocampi]|uniref:Chemotaxis protein PomA n=1 Tax=Oceanibacterium hippocampi TaxID=745714 RepID=A0A1Y5TT16_9PROT|nr:MotA/TolQ/ExbB proton channel family protein [Oceanibacterium hippocampi]SLN69538.1 Chemotaxis protein PomA [Oceanibacterium hippocampi]
MDIATIIGLFGAFGLVGAAIAVGGSVLAFINVPSMLIVVAGTFLVTMMCFSLNEVIRAQGLILKTLFFRITDPEDAAHDMLELAEKARKEGVLVLQKTVDNYLDEPFLHKALLLVVDGLPGDDVERVLQRDLAAMTQRHQRGAGILRKAAEIAPAMGLIGTLVGLVQMLSNLNDPASIGPAMAVALLTTFYGALLANMVFSPLAAKLERNSEAETVLCKIYTQAAVSIGRQENPRRLEMILNTMLPPAQRLEYFA